MIEQKACKRCGTSAASPGTMLCDPCWELDRHLHKITIADVPLRIRREIQAEALEAAIASMANTERSQSSFASGYRMAVKHLKKTAEKLRGGGSC